MFRVSRPLRTNHQSPPPRPCTDNASSPSPLHVPTGRYRRPGVRFHRRAPGLDFETALHAEPPREGEAVDAISCVSRSAPTPALHADRVPERFAPLAAELELTGRSPIRRSRSGWCWSPSRSIVSTTCSPGGSRMNSIEIPCVISNHDTFRGFVEWHGIPFHHVPVSADNKARAYVEVQRIFEEVGGDTMVLARYMQILPPELCKAYPDASSTFITASCPASSAQAVSPGLGQWREADRRYLSLREPSSTRARSSSRT